MIRKLLGSVLTLYGIAMLFILVYGYFFDTDTNIHVSKIDLGIGLLAVCSTIYVGDNWRRGKRSTEGL